jgi:hypothetical protein
MGGNSEKKAAGEGRCHHLEGIQWRLYEVGARLAGELILNMLRSIGYLRTPLTHAPGVETGREHDRYFR